MFKYYIVLLFIFGAVSQNLYPNDVDLQSVFGKNVKYAKIVHSIKQSKIDIISLFKLYINDNTEITLYSESVQKTIKENKKISNWNELKKADRVVLYIKVKHLSLEKISLQNPRIFERILAIAKTKQQDTPRTSDKEGAKSSSSMFYMASYGLFYQDGVEKTQIDFFQNSPMTLGFSNILKLSNPRFSVSSSLYISTLVAAVSEFAQEDFEVPPEIGLNSYLEYKVSTGSLRAFFGIDYEQFSSLDLRTLNEEGQIKADLNDLIFATIGASYLFSIFSYKVFSKISYSSVISSEIESKSENLAFKGSKIMLYLNYRFSQKWFIHTLLKHHSLNSNTNLSSTRVGIGFGYNF